MTAALTHPRRPVDDFSSGFSPAATGGGGTVHVAVGRSTEKTLALLRWTCGMFPGHEIVLLHVHRPSPFIPTPLGKLSAARVNPEMLEAFRHEEKEETMKVLARFLMVCSRSKVKASVVTTETDEVQKGIVDLVNLHFIRKLVIGSTTDFMKGKRTSCKACHIAENAPTYCEMWFVNKRKLVWTRPASASSNMRFPSSQNEFLNCRSESSLGGDEYVGKTVSFSSSAKSMEECLRIKLAELKREVDESKDEAKLKLIEPKKLEDEAMEVFNKVKAMEKSRSREKKLRIDAEEALRITIREQDKLLEEIEKTTQQMQKSTRNIALFDSRVEESSRRCKEVSEEVKLIQVSISSLSSEKKQLQEQKSEATRWLDRWKSSSHEKCEDPKENRIVELKEDASELPELLLTDIEDATCDFCDSLRIGEGEYGAVYRGMISEKNVAVKKLHGYDMQKHAEFKRAVQVLSKLHHPRLVKLIGTCLESWLLVYEYLPDGSLQNYFCDKRKISALNWKTRARIVADIASGLLFLHSSKPEKIVHGNLKPENLFLDSENRCKISDYGDNMIIPSKASSGICLYTDPESRGTRSVTHKSDIYSFGIIILQLVTGKTKRRLASNVRKAIVMGKTSSILDLSAGDWSSYVARRLLDLGLQFCEANSKDRPDLTPSLARELECVPFLEDLTVPSFFLCPIVREMMHDPHVAADGFTYEGDALRGWLRSGRETSPMTNLRLSHLELTPNYALRLCIRDWVANHEIDS